MNVILTGAVGIGKTTVCQKVITIVQGLGHTCGGILTPKATDRGITILDIQTGQRETLASIDKAYGGPRAGKYFFSQAGIEFGIRAINRGVSSDILFVDEIGHLELRGEGFARSLELIRAGRVKNSIVVIREYLLPDFLAQLDFKYSVSEATIESREQLPQEILSRLDL